MEFKQKFYLIFIPFFIIISKWLLVFIFFKDFNSHLKILFNFNDISYFPFIISLSDLDLSPTFHTLIQSQKLITFPLASIIYHAFTFKIFGIFSYVFCDIVFVILTYYSIYLIVRKVGGGATYVSLISIILLFSLPFYLELLHFFIKNDFIFFLKKQIFSYYLLDFRYPRPLVANIYFYLFLTVLLNFFKNKKIKKKTFFLLGLLTSFLIQSFVFLALFCLLTFFLILIFKIFKDKLFIKNNFTNLKYYFFSLIFFSIPFIFQIFMGENDYSYRMGLFKINFLNKIDFIILTGNHFFNFKYLFLITIYICIYIYLKRLKNKNYISIYNFYLILFVSSFILPFVFIIFSPFMIWYKHFLDVKNLIFLLGFVFFIPIIINKFFSLFINKKFLLIFFVIFFLFANLLYQYFSISNHYNTNKEYYNDFSKVIKKANFYTNKKKLDIFSNSNLINYYFIYQRQNILFPNGFHVSLSDDQLEQSMINSFKLIGFSSLDFNKYIENNITWKSSNNISHISGYKYQFSPLFTYFQLDQYQKKEIKFLNNNKLFLSESTALSKNEIDRLVNRFNNHKINYDLKPSIIILDKRREKHINFIPSNEYLELENNKSFKLLINKSFK